MINAQSLVTTIHRKPEATGYPDPRDAGPNELLQPLYAPHLEVRLADLGLG